MRQTETSGQAAYTHTHTHVRCCHTCLLCFIGRQAAEALVGGGCVFALDRSIVWMMVFTLGMEIWIIGVKFVSMNEQVNGQVFFIYNSLILLRYIFSRCTLWESPL